MGARAVSGIGIAAIVVIALVFAILSSNYNTWLPVAAILAPLGALFVARRRFQLVALSPVWIIALIISAIGIAGFFLAADLAGLRGGGIVISIPPGDIAPTAYVYAASIAAFVLGALLVAAFRGRPQKIKFSAIEVAPRTRRIMLAVAVVPVLMLVASLGTAFISRDVYLAGGLGLRALYGVGQQLATATIAIVGYLLIAGSRAQRVSAGVLMVVYFALLFSMGSRRIALAPVVLALGMIMAKPTRVWLKLLIAGALATLLLPLPLLLRGSQAHGLLPYLGALQSYDLGEVDWLTTLNNILISYPTTALTAFHVNQIPLDNLFISLNPLPGDIAGWYEISGSMSLNAWTPFSTIGELWNYGPLAALAVWVGLGALSAALDGAVRKLWVGGIPFVALAVVGLAAIFAIQALQYNVRQSTRMMLYATLVAIAGAVYLHFREGRRKTAWDRERLATRSLSHVV